jgi:hypothetical protein
MTVRPRPVNNIARRYVDSGEARFSPSAARPDAAGGLTAITAWSAGVLVYLVITVLVAIRLVVAGPGRENPAACCPRRHSPASRWVRRTLPGTSRRKPAGFGNGQGGPGR